MSASCNWVNLLQVSSVQFTPDRVLWTSVEFSGVCDPEPSVPCHQRNCRFVTSPSRRSGQRSIRTHIHSEWYIRIRIYFVFIIVLATRGYVVKLLDFTVASVNHSCSPWLWSLVARKDKISVLDSGAWFCPWPWGSSPWFWSWRWRSSPWS